MPNIINWNTNRVKNMDLMFANCTSLISLPDISKWNTNNKINMFLDIQYDLYDFLFDDSNPDIFKLYDYDYEFLLNNIKKSLKDFMN